MNMTHTIRTFEHVEIDGEYGTRRSPYKRVKIYSLEGKGEYSVHGAIDGVIYNWHPDGTSGRDLYGASLNDLVLLEKEPTTYPSVDWISVDKKYNWLARDSNGAVFFYGIAPRIIYGNRWFSGTSIAHAQSHASLSLGNCDWKDSLVRRPE